MLSRAIAQGVARATRLSTLQRTPLTASRIATPTSTLWIRGMAKNSRSKTDKPHSQPKAQPEAQPEISQPASSPTTKPSPDAAESATPPPDFNSLPDLTKGIPST